MTLSIPIQSVPLDHIAELLEDQYAKHLVNGNPHILAVLRYQAVFLNIKLDRQRIGRLLPRSWSVADFERANYKAHNHRRRARQAGVRDEHFTGIQWLELVAEADGKCTLCHREFTKENYMTVEHVIPLSAPGNKQGRNAIGNIAVACYECNQERAISNFNLLYKGDK